MAKKSSTKAPKAAKPKAASKSKATPPAPSLNAQQRHALRREYAEKLKGADAATRRALRKELASKV